MRESTAPPVPIPVGMDVPDGVTRWIRPRNVLARRPTRFYEIAADGVWRISRKGVRGAMIGLPSTAAYLIDHLGLEPIWPRSMKVRKGL